MHADTFNSKKNTNSKNIFRLAFLKIPMLLMLEKLYKEYKEGKDCIPSPCTDCYPSEYEIGHQQLCSMSTQKKAKLTHPQHMKDEQQCLVRMNS